MLTKEEINNTLEKKLNYSNRKVVKHLLLKDRRPNEMRSTCLKALEINAKLLSLQDKLCSFD